MFSIYEPVRAIVTSVTVRSEKHGDQREPAVSAGLEFDVPNTVLYDVDPRILHMLYEPAEPGALRQGDLPGLEAVDRPKLRNGVVTEMHLGIEVHDWRAHIVYGVDNEWQVALEGLKVDNVRFEPLNDGVTRWSLRIGTNKVNREIMGHMGMLHSREVMLRELYAAPAAESVQTVPAIAGEGSGVVSSQNESLFDGACSTCQGVGQVMTGFSEGGAPIFIACPDCPAGAMRRAA